MLDFWHDGKNMELIRGIHNLRPRHQGCVATIGNFDGVHLGHQAIIAQLKSQAETHELPSVVMLFEPQPREFFDPDRAPARLMSFREKCELIAELGVDRVLCVNFNQRFCAQSAQIFCDRVLINGLGIRHLVVGDDFRFGSDRKGDFKLLQAVGQQQGFSVEHTATFRWHSQRVSSTRIRHHLELSEFEEAETLLGRPFFMSGRVTHGQKLGRTIGVPTANLLPKRVKTPVTGVFAVEVAGIDAHLRAGVANLGTRPTLGGEQVRLEVHLLDFEGDLYGKHIRVMFRHKIRDEKKFDGMATLTAAIHKDIATAQHYFKGS